jgi:hypothetical protein
MPEYDNAQFSINDIIKRLMKMEDKVMAVEDHLSEINDLQLINKLDIINLKNEIDRMRIGIRAPAEVMPPAPKRAPLPPRPKPIEIKSPSPPPKPIIIEKSPENMCRSCGAWVPPSARFCTKCGKKRGGMK